MATVHLITEADHRRTRARIVREAILSFRDDPSIGDTMVRLATTATEDQLINLARRIR